MKTIKPIILVTIIFILSNNLNSQNLENYNLLEDLWGNKIDLSNTKKDIIFHHISTSNCGYCLIEGDFIDENYFKNNILFGGINFNDCFYNPQLDVYSFIKHFRNESIPVISFTPFPDKYIRYGFPGLVSFRNGKYAYGMITSPYEEAFRNFRDTMWVNKDVIMHPSSPLHMATRFTDENQSHFTVKVIPNNNEKQYSNMNKYCSTTNCCTAKYEQFLNDEDLKMNLYYDGYFTDFNFNEFKDKSIPISIKNNQLKIGDYVFDCSNIGLNCCFPNPYNNERYIVMTLKGDRINKSNFQNWVDFTIYNNSSNNEPNVLINGFFKKDVDNNWFFNDSLVYISPEIMNKCEGGYCKIPSNSSSHKLNQNKIGIKIDKKNHSKYKTYILGESNCRFPSISSDENNGIWVTWEENGNVLATSLNTLKNEKLIFEGDGSDSFNPLVLANNNLIWIFYLNNKDGFYRLYGKYFDKNRYSEEYLISESGVFDVFTPAAISNNNNKITIAWSEWKANQRYLKYRTIQNQVLGEIKNVHIKIPNNNSFNDWYPSLAVDDSGKVWGAWNQHYPAFLCVYSGNFEDEATAVTKLAENGGEEENGGYPSIVIDKNDNHWIFWETWGFDIEQGKTQNILASVYNKNLKKWSLSQKINTNTDVSYNQTPCAIVDHKGIIWVAYSSRSLTDDYWKVYISKYDNDNWSEPIQISERYENARSPKVSIDEYNNLWITWHSGIGKHMKIKVIEYLNE